MQKVSGNQAVWYVIFSIAFIAIFGLVFWELTNGLDTVRWVYYITVFDVVILSLATFRMIRLITYDKIFNFVRQWFLNETDDGWVKPRSGPRRTITELIECLWCSGLWAALFVIALYFSAPVGRIFVILLAVAGVGSFLQNLSKTVARIGAK